jgi:hypothetical protein
MTTEREGLTELALLHRSEIIARQLATVAYLTEDCDDDGDFNTNMQIMGVLMAFHALMFSVRKEFERLHDKYHDLEAEYHNLEVATGRVKKVAAE